MSVTVPQQNFLTDDYPTFAGFRERTVLTVIVVSGALAISGTSSVEPTKVWDELSVYGIDATDCGTSLTAADSHSEQEVEATRQAISELRRLSGLTWDQMGQIFEVSRRSVHHWASGKPLNAANEQRLMRVLDVIRHAYRGSARETRAALLDTSEGTTPFEMLVAQRFEQARAALGRGQGRAHGTLSKLSREARDARKPPPPATLVEGVSERIDNDPGRARAARSVRVRARGNS